MLIALAGGLALGVAAVLADRWINIELPRSEWRCTAQHPEQAAVRTAQGQTFVTTYACDQWSRR